MRMTVVPPVDAKLRDLSSDFSHQPWRIPVLSTMRHVTTLIGGALTSILVLAACGGGPGAGISAETTVTAQFNRVPTSFDPAAAAAIDDWAADRLLFDTLLRMDNDGSVVGGLATKWEVESASVVTLTIRKDATCADGTPITAETVADSLNYYAGDPAHVSAATAFGPGQPTITANAGDSTVTVETAQPYVHVLKGLALPQSGVICPAGLADKAGLQAGTVEAAFSGPYTLREATPGVRYVFGLRPDYNWWPDFADPPQGDPVQTLEFGVLTDESTTANQVLSDNLKISMISGTQIDRFQGREEDFNLSLKAAGNLYIVFNERPGRVFSEQANRTAAAQAIDRTAWNQAYSGGVNPLWTSLVPPAYPCSNNDAELLHEFDLPAAEQVLAGTEIKVVTQNGLGAQARDSEYLEKALLNAGARVDLQVYDLPRWNGIITDPAGGDWDLTIIGDGNQLATISGTMQRVLGPTPAEGGRNVGAADNPEGAAALEKASKTVDEAQRCALETQMQESVLTRVDAIPLTGGYRMWVLPKNASAIFPADAVIDFSTVRVAE